MTHKANGISIVNITKAKGNLNLIRNYSIKVSEKWIGGKKEHQMINIFNNVLIRKVNPTYFPTVFKKDKTFHLRIAG